ISMQEAVTMFMRTMGLRAWGTEAAPRTGNGTATMNIYPCAPGGPNDYVFIMANTTRMWDTLCVAIERPELVNDPRFADQMGRFQHADELYPEIAAWTCRRTKHEAMRILGEAGVPCSAVMDTLDLFHDPHLSERGFIQTVEHPVAGEVKLMSFPPRMSGSKVPLKAAPLLGDHTDAVLSNDLGLGAEQLEELRRCGVIA
ncbi:MAG TPA: CoA transferase, partial [Dehalococcoidia bacterium]|nr:CoA transferase [Dehalococcoidia bacterium]